MTCIYFPSVTTKRKYNIFIRSESRVWYTAESTRRSRCRTQFRDYQIIRILHRRFEW